MVQPKSNRKSSLTVRRDISHTNFIVTDWVVTIGANVHLSGYVCYLYSLYAHFASIMQCPMSSAECMSCTLYNSILFVRRARNTEKSVDLSRQSSFITFIVFNTKRSQLVKYSSLSTTRRSERINADVWQVNETQAHHSRCTYGVCIFAVFKTFPHRIHSPFQPQTNITIDIVCGMSS